MRKFLSYMMAGALVSSLSVLACSSETTRDGGDDEEETSSSSSGGSSSGKTGSSSSGGNGSSSSSGGSSSGGGVEFDVEVTGLTISPATGKVGTASNHTFTFTYTGNPADAEGRVALLFGASGVPNGVTADPITAKAFDELSEEGKVSGTFTIKPTVAGTYKLSGGFDADQDDATTDDRVFADTDFVVTE